MKIFVAQHPTEAHIVCGLLQQAQIPCEVRGDTLFSVRGEVPFEESTAPYVWLLNPNFAKQSKELIEIYLAPVTTTQPQWRCQNCGEENDPQFAICWNCGKADESTQP